MFCKIACCSVLVLSDHAAIRTRPRFSGRTGQPAGVDLSERGIRCPAGCQPVHGVRCLGRLRWHPAQRGRASVLIGWTRPGYKGGASVHGLRAAIRLQCSGQLPVWEERDPFTQRLLAIKHYWQISEGTRTFGWRPSSPTRVCATTWSGFSTAVRREYADRNHDHLKRGWIRANGMPQSDEATLVEHFIRHGDRITTVRSE